jgi:hypothetical protein
MGGLYLATGHKASFFVGDLASILSDYTHLPKPDIVITDPPRGGMPKQCVADILLLGHLLLHPSHFERVLLSHSLIHPNL